jgi:ParB-like chromosome segregation protein Spo0J
LTEPRLPAEGVDKDGDAPERRAPAVVVLSVADLLPADSPRALATDPEHVRLLAELDGPLPPILVHHETGRVIDGMHRLQAAHARGAVTIEAELFHGPADDAFVEAVRRNVRHGRPLTRREREVAALRILHSHPALSDRALSEICGLSPKTVGKLRRREGGTLSEAVRRTGRDGRERPVDPSGGRQHAATLFLERPDASTREVAREAGIAQATAADVRDRVQRGQPPVPRRPRLKGDASPATTASRAPPSTPIELSTIAHDRAFQTDQETQAFLDWFLSHAVLADDWALFVAAIPLSRAYIVARLSRQFAAAWADFADTLERRAREH